MKTTAGVSISITTDLPEGVAPDQIEAWGGRTRSWRPKTVTERLELGYWRDPVRWDYRVRIDGVVLTSKGNPHASQRDHSTVETVPEWLAPHLRGQAQLRSDLDLVIALAD